MLTAQGFFFIWSKKAIDKDRLQDSLCAEYKKEEWLSEQQYFACSSDHTITDKNLSVLSGRLATTTAETDFSYLHDFLNQNKWPLDDKVSGSFTGLSLNRAASTVHLFTDPVGMYNLFYYLDDEMLVVSSTTTPIAKYCGCAIDQAGLFLEMSGHNSAYAKLTAWENVFRLLPGECLEIKDFNITARKYDLSIKLRDGAPPENFAESTIDLIEAETKKLYSHKKVLLSLSGGIDSRVNIAPLLREESIDIAAINYGQKEGSDTKIPLRIAQEQGLKFDIKDPANNLFAPRETLFDIAANTDAVYIGYWHDILLQSNNYGDRDFFLLGDMLDILRAKRVGSLGSRAFRLKYFFKKFLTGAELPMTEMTEDHRAEFKKAKHAHLDNTIDKSKELTGVQEDIIEKIRVGTHRDLDRLLEHLDKYYCQYLQSYEELYGMFTIARLTMGKQVNILQYGYRAEAPLANIKILRAVMNVAPQHRYSDNLTHKMLIV